MDQSLKGKRFAVLATDGVEQSEFTKPIKAITEAGGEPVVVSIKTGDIKAWSRKEWGESFPVDLTVDSVSADEFAGLVLPGGVMNPDTLRMNEQAVEFVKDFYDAKKPIAAICHGPWMLVEADVVKGKKVTSWPSLQTDLRNAGAEWVDEEVVVDQGMVTSRKPDDLPAFTAKMVEEFAEGRHPNE